MDKENSLIGELYEEACPVVKRIIRKSMEAERKRHNGRVSPEWEDWINGLVGVCREGCSEEDWPKGRRRT